MPATSSTLASMRHETRHSVAARAMRLTPHGEEALSRQRACTVRCAVSNHEAEHVMAGLRPGHPRLPHLSAAKTWMPGIADKFTQSAQGRLLWPGMTSFATETDSLAAF